MTGKFKKINREVLDLFHNFFQFLQIPYLDFIYFVKAKGGLDFAINKMEEYKSQAKQLLSDFPKNEYRDALELMLNYVTERKI